MTEPSVIPEDILTALIIVVLFISAAVLWLYWFGPKLAAMRVRRNTEADDSGDQGGIPEPVEQLRPKAPHTGCGLPVGASEDLLDIPKFLQRVAGDQQAVRERYDMTRKPKRAGDMPMGD